MIGLLEKDDGGKELIDYVRSHFPDNIISYLNEQGKDWFSGTVAMIKHRRKKTTAKTVSCIRSEMEPGKLSEAGSSI